MKFEFRSKMYAKTQGQYTIILFTRLTSWESACKIVAQRGKISPLYPLPPSLVFSLFLPSLTNKSKTKAFPVHLKTILEVVLSELKIWDFHHYVQERIFLWSETFAFFETTKSFSGARNISVHALAATSSGIRTRQRCKNMNGYCDFRTMLRHALVN